MKGGVRMVRLPSRQVHLDFHTSELIPGVGERFDRRQFQQALKLGNLNSITVFAKCHHSNSYYPTRAGIVHPTMPGGYDLTGAMIDAAHEIGVRAPVYITVGWSAQDAEAHPEWVMRRKDGAMATTNYDVNAAPDAVKPMVSWKNLCVGTEYRDLIYTQTREVCERYSTLDGLFFDICFMGPCYCESCLAAMKAEGLDPEKPEDAMAYSNLRWKRFTRACTEILSSYHPEATIFFNSGADIYHPEFHDIPTHFEMEDLPTTWGGYEKMPPRAKFFARYGKDFLGMTGKFHTSWGEFGGYKNPDALAYECAYMLAYGARCSVGDQMPPDGEMDIATYKLIGHAYRYVEQIEPWCYDAQDTTTLGVYLSGAPESDEGLTSILLENRLDFDIVSPGAELSRYECLILPDCVRLDETEAARLRSFVMRGGSVLLTGTSGLCAQDDCFAIDVGAEYMGAPAFDIDYLRMAPAIAIDWADAPFLCYGAAQKVRVTTGESLADVYEPWFNRRYGHYCSHQHAPYRREAASAGIVRKGNVVYMAHALCAMYHAHGAQVHRDALIHALRLIYAPRLTVALPSAGRARMAKQEGRYVIHMLYGQPVQRGRTSVLEDFPVMRDIAVSATIEGRVKRAYLAPQMREIPFSQYGAQVTLSVPEMSMHQMVVLDV